MQLGSRDFSGGQASEDEVVLGSGHDHVSGCSKSGSYID